MQDYKNWKNAIIEQIEQSGMTHSDAQGVVMVQEFAITQSCGLGLDVKAAAAKIIAASASALPALPVLAALPALAPSSALDLTFAPYLREACDQGEMGFYFEEGGCWGMALALNDAIGGELILRDDFVHVYVRVNGKLFDWQGEAAPVANGQVITREELLLKAAAYGFDSGRVDLDRASADLMIEEARELALAPQASQKLPCDALAGCR